jgi:hypothetical protein
MQRNENQNFGYYYFGFLRSQTQEGSFKLLGLGRDYSVVEDETAAAGAEEEDVASHEDEIRELNFTIFLGVFSGGF